MSHAVRHSFSDFKDPIVLARAFERLGWKVERDAKIRAWYQSKKFPYVAVNPNKNGYDWGFAINNGKIELEGDTSMMDEQVWKVLGRDFSHLKQAYSLEALSDWSKVNNGTMIETKAANGIVEVEIEMETFA